MLGLDDSRARRRVALGGGDINERENGHEAAMSKKKKKAGLGAHVVTASWREAPVTLRIGREGGNRVGKERASLESATSSR